MGASESTARTNVTREDEENSQQESGGSSMGGGTAAVALAAAGMAAWGISRMLSDNTDSQRNQNAMKMKGTTVFESAYSPNSSTNNYQGDQTMSVSFPTRITWSPPPLGRFKMNTDAGCRPYGYGRSSDNVQRGPSGYGGILRDHRGKWILGFHGFLDESDCLTAEFHGIYNGLSLLDRLGQIEAILESDCTGAIGWITQHDFNTKNRRPMIIDNCWEIIMKCKRLISKNKISVISCPREANKCADKLASMAIEKKEGYKEIMNVPDEIKYIVDQESQMV